MSGHRELTFFVGFAFSGSMFFPSPVKQLQGYCRATAKVTPFRAYPHVLKRNVRGVGAARESGRGRDETRDREIAGMRRRGRSRRAD